MGRCLRVVFGGLVWVGVHGCAEPAACAASGGEWTDCAVQRAWCIDGAVVPNDQDRPAVCEAGCSCPADAPVWDAAAGCVTEATCVGDAGA